MAHSYDQIYLDDAMHNLAEALEVASYFYKFKLDFFMHMFITSGVARQFEAGNPKYIAGKSGIELVEETVIRTYGPSKLIECASYYMDPTEEYWTGWVLAYFQWYSGKSFREIQNIITIEDLKNKYHPYHEMDEDKIVEYIYDRAKNIQAAKRLQAYRKKLGLSQSELSKAAGVNLRTLQQYESGAKDISKASAATVVSLGTVLKCPVEDLILL